MMCLNCDNQNSKYFLEWREKLNKEMGVFNGKVNLAEKDGETASTMSGATGMTGF